MNLKDRESLTALLNQTKERYQSLSRQIHWTEADSECLDDFVNSRKQETDIANRITRVAGAGFSGNIISSFLAYKAWQRTKAVYSFSQELVDTMSQTEDTKILTSLLERLPFNDMLFFFPEGVLPTIKNEETAGMYVHIEKHPDFLWVFFNYFDRILNSSQIYPGNAIAFPISDGMKVSQVFETPQYLDWLSTYKRTMLIDRHLNEQEAEESLAAHKRSLNIAINLLYYLSSEKPDVKPIKQRKKTHGPRESTESAIKLHEVGAEYAEIVYRRLKDNTLSDEEDDEEGSERTVTRSTKKRRPHPRRAHWQQYWTGKGREIPVVHWIPDLFVGANRDDQATVVYEVAKESLKGKRNPNTSKKKRSK